jgi:uncharacterized membrane protein
MALHQHIAKDGFRLRGLGMSRIDGFSDVVFGFALTLIVVSLEVPRTYAELHELLLGFLPFLICFVFLIMVWWAHYRYFRRFHLHDTATILLNSALLFTVLFYVYPLKFLFTIASRQLTGGGAEGVFTAASQIRELVTVYGIGFTAIYLLFAAMYWNAWRQRDLLRLSPLETTLTLTYVVDDFGVACIGLIVCVSAQLFPPAEATKACYFFFLIGVWKTIHGNISGKLARKALERTSAEDRAPLPHQD